MLVARASQIPCSTASRVTAPIRHPAQPADGLQRRSLITRSVSSVTTHIRPLMSSPSRSGLYQEKVW